MGQQLYRPDPIGPPGAYDTYGVHLPRATHTVPVSCELVGCETFAKGWAVTVIPGSEDERTMAQATDGTADGHRRHHLKVEVTAEGWHRYVFPAGQPCFAASAHRMAVKPATTTIRRGDWRKADRPTVVPVPEWQERLGENQQAIIDRQARG